MRARAPGRRAPPPRPARVVVAALLAVVGAACQTPAPEPAGPPLSPPTVRVAFLADSGLSPRAARVLDWLRSEEVDLVLHQGDFDYEDAPLAWMAFLDRHLGPRQPFLASLGNHDAAEWKGYVKDLGRRTERTPGLLCNGVPGVRQRCTFRGLTVALVAPGVSDLGGYEAFVDEALQGAVGWRICSFHIPHVELQAGGKTAGTDWPVYEACRRQGALVATGHAHGYARTAVLDDYPALHVVDDTSPFTLRPGASLAFVSGLGGQSVYADSQRAGHPLAVVYGKARGAVAGALVCDFEVDRPPPLRARCRFVDVDRGLIDRFELELAGG